MVVGKEKEDQKQNQQECRMMIQDGLGASIFYDIFGAKTNVLLQRTFSKSHSIPAPKSK